MILEAWHSQPFNSVLLELNTDEQNGLTLKEAQTRLLHNGENSLKESKGVTALTLLMDQLKNVLVFILIIAVVLSAFLGHAVEAFVIGSIVLFAVLLGFFQEYRAEKVMEALKGMAAPTANVLRGGKEVEVASKEIVQGDIVLLAAGDRIPADGRLIESINLQTDESALTGESLPVSKTVEIIEQNVAIGDKTNMVFSGTTVTYGRGKAIITGTGMNSEFGKIATMLQSVNKELTPLQKNLDKVGKTLAKGSLVIVAIISILGYVRGEPLLDILLFGIALAVAVVPEALPAVVTISLAISVQRMVKRNALIRRQPVVETLGSTTIICTDKTGTLTKDEMTVRSLYTAGTMFNLSGSGYSPTGILTTDNKETQPTDALKELLIAGVLSSDATFVKSEQGYSVKGDPTEGGIVVAAAKIGILKDDMDVEMPRLDEIPFTSETKRMTTLHQTSETSMAYAKGAPEVILNSCTRLWGKHKEIPLTEEERQKILDTAKEMASGALRVIAIARKGVRNIDDATVDMKFLGLVGMIDPPRLEAKEAIKKCKQAGIRVLMITGDHPITAAAIATELGIITNEHVIIGPEVDNMTDDEFNKTLQTVGVFARVSPEHKLRIVSALQASGEIVAMTGDGVNEAPALKKADIGIAMGVTGTDVTKEAAAMQLTDDNFASIVAAIEEGRGVFSNIKKYLIYLLSANLGEVGIMTGATIMGLPLPLTAAQILYVNLATDGLPALALAVDPHEPDLMNRPPRDPKVGIFTKKVISLLIARGACITVASLGIFTWAILTGKDLLKATTLCFVTLILIEFFMAYVLRSERKSVLHSPFSNKWLNLSILIQLPVLFAILYVPILNKPFHITAPTLQDWFIMIPVALLTIPILEIVKYVVNKNE